MEDFVSSEFIVYIFAPIFALIKEAPISFMKCAVDNKFSKFPLIAVISQVFIVGALSTPDKFIPSVVIIAPIFIVEAV